MKSALEELRAIPQWVCWKYEMVTGKDGQPKETKVPYHPETNRHASSTDPSTWTDYETAVAAEGFDGIGFVVTENDPYIGNDLDTCLTRDSERAPWAEDALRALNSYTEVTPSGAGLRVWIKGKLPPGKRQFPQDNPLGIIDHPPAIEMYERGRYFTFSGRGLPEFPAEICERQEEIDALHARLCPPPAPKPPPRASPKSLSISDQAILQAISVAQNGIDVLRLYNGFWEGGKYRSQSEADEALCCHLAFYTKDALQIDSLFRSSGLMREKWDRPYSSGGTYGDRTIENALAMVTEQYHPPAPRPLHPADDPSYRAQAPPVDRAPEEVSMSVPVEPDAAEVLKQGYGIVRVPRPEEHTPPLSARRQVKIHTSPELMAMNLPARLWAIPGYLPEGLAIFAGKPKTRKSFAVLSEAVAIATPGGKVFSSIPVETGDVLCLALEDNEESMQDRLGQMLQGAPPPSRLHLSFEWPRLNDGGLDAIDGWLGRHPEARLVIIDVLNKVRPRRKTNNGNPYEEDYEACEPLMALADRYHVAIQVVHHLRKLTSEDPLDLVLGSIGMTGAPDTIWVWRGSRGSPRVQLFGTGRRIKEEFDRTLLWKPETVSFTDQGDAEEYALNEDYKEILAVIKLRGPRSPKQLQEELGGEYPTLCSRLRRLEEKGWIRNTGGRYAVGDQPTL